MIHATFDDLELPRKAGLMDWWAQFRVDFSMYAHAIWSTANLFSVIKLGETKVFTGSATFRPWGGTPRAENFLEGVLTLTVFEFERMLTRVLFAVANLLVIRLIRLFTWITMMNSRVISTVLAPSWVRPTSFPHVRQWLTLHSQSQAHSVYSDISLCHSSWNIHCDRVSGIWLNETT